MEYRKQNTSTYLRCLSGWWFQPLWKIVISQLGIRKIKNVPNHQPAIIYCISTTPHLARCCWVTPLPPFAWSWLWRRSHFLQRPIRRPAALAAGGCRAKGLFRSRKKRPVEGIPSLEIGRTYIYIYMRHGKSPAGGNYICLHITEISDLLVVDFSLPCLMTYASFGDDLFGFRSLFPAKHTSLRAHSYNKDQRSGQLPDMFL